MKRLVLIDGKSVFYRGYYAMGALSLADGTPTGGVYGFAAIAMEIVRKLSPTKVVVAWDSKTSTARRKAIFADYKAGRIKPGDDFYTQIPLLKELIIELGWNFVEIDNFEADDIIGTLSRQADEVLDDSGKCEWETFIISSDLDMLQIVDENTHMWRIIKGFSEIQQIDVAEIEAKYGILKTQFLDLKALKGDASDNIPGVPGVGEKTAAKLLSEYGDLDGIYRHIDEIRGTLKTKLEAGKESAYMSYELAQIMFNAPVALSEMRDFEFDAGRVVRGLKKLEFNSLIRKLKLENVKVPTATNTIPNESFENDGAKDNSISDLDSDSDLNLVVPSKLDSQTIIDWNVKTLMHDNSEVAREIFEGKKFWDLSQAAFLLNPLAREEPMLVVPEEEGERQLAEFKKFPALYRVYTEMDLPMIPVLYKMEKWGMLIDREYFRNLQSEYTKEVGDLAQKIYDLAGKEFNINSPVQLSEVLFIDLRLPTKGIKKTSRGYSTGAKELLKLKDSHPIVSKIMEYREASKLLGTYIIPMPELADAEGRIHTTFTQNVTATGRLSSKDPNLQNIPVRTGEGKRIRTGFVAPEGRVLVSADYSQFELRLAAVLAGDKPLIDGFNQNVDIHTKTASEAFGVPFDEVTKEQRRAAKAINFGIIYGMSLNGLVEATGMSYAEAKNFMDNYRKIRAPIMQYMEQTLAHAREKGYVETYYGRRRPTPDVRSSNFVIRQAAERAASNMPIQGTEADLMKRTMIEIDRVLPDGAKLVMQVHDSLIVECDEGMTETVADILKTKMEGVAPELEIKLAVEVTVGKNWGEL